MELLNPLNGSDYGAKSVSFTGTAGNTSTWPPGPQGVIIWSDAACYVSVGEGVVATTTLGTPIPAYTPIPFIVPITVSGPWRVSAIQIDTAGTVYCKPMNIR